MEPNPTARLRRSTWHLSTDETWYGDVVVLDNEGDLVPVTWACAAAALVGIPAGSVLLVVLGFLADSPDFARVMGILAAVCIPLAVHVWFASRRCWRIGALVDSGQHDRARRLLEARRRPEDALLRRGRTGRALHHARAPRGRLRRGVRGRGEPSGSWWFAGLTRTNRVV